MDEKEKGDVIESKISQLMIFTRVLVTDIVKICQSEPSVSCYLSLHEH